MLVVWGADMDYTCNMLGLPHFNRRAMCRLCLANTSTMPFNNFHHDAGWQGTRVDNTTFMNRLRQPLHPVVSHPWLNMFSYRRCALHMFDHHGLASHVIANILWAHISGERECNAIPGSNMDDRITFLNNGKQAFYNANHVENRLGTLIADNIHSLE